MTIQPQSTAAERWRSYLQEWAIPKEILDAAPESPWGFPTELFARRADASFDRRSPSDERALEALPRGGSVLDVGCGGGAASLPLADEASRLIGVDASAELLEAFRQRVTAKGKEVRTVEGSWPGVASETPMADVVVCHHVFYNVPDLGAFAQALTSHARRRVVVELTAMHPMSRLNELWKHFYGLTRPSRPIADDAVAVLRELHLRPERLDWEEPGLGWLTNFETQGELIAWVRRRLCLPAERDAEIWSVLQTHVVPAGSSFSFAPSRVATLWWNPKG